MRNLRNIHTDKGENNASKDNSFFLKRSRVQSHDQTGVVHAAITHDSRWNKQRTRRLQRTKQEERYCNEHYFFFPRIKRDRMLRRFATFYRA